MGEEQGKECHHTTGEENVAETDGVFSIRGQVTGSEIVQFRDDRIGGSRDEDGDPDPGRPWNQGFLRDVF